ncbi:phage portal protein [Roseibium suaedae]|uniref:Phage portal protein, lambda family n=1 Tax=Roseibium suaedae TaxID=735517 RepID=A0A1M7PM28_9HYPH|nr:phage portal protein [Roseibium suaedae]SHN18305.1 phage portal protein, lambda family [Roseibium suaedae]
MNTVTIKPVVRVKSGDATGASARMMSAFGGPAYSAADTRMQGLMNWAPNLNSADADWLPDRDLAVSRTRDLERNEGAVSSGVDRQVDMLVGGTFRLNSKPSARLLGISQSEADELGQSIQTEWQAYAEDPIFRCDAERQLNFVGLMGLMAREFVAGGEAFGVLRWLEKPGRDYATAMHVIDTDRLCNPNGTMDTATLRGGVETDEDGAPIAYHVRKAHPSDVFSYGAESWIWQRFERWDEVGDWQRPKVIHCYDKRRPGQSRGVSRLVTALSRMKMLASYSKAELNTAALNASIVGAIYTQLGADYAAETLGGANFGQGTDWKGFNQSRSEFYQGGNSMDQARFLTLFPTDRLDLNSQPRQTSGFASFQQSFLRSLAASLGVSYEQLSMDWSQTNYSSARAALNEVWRGIHRLRGLLVSGIANLWFAAWLEEALDRGKVDVPAGAKSFYEAPAGYLRGDWIGPARGYIDPVKEAQAAIMRMGARMTTLERETAEQGGDWEVNIEQLAREAEHLARNNLTPVAAASVPAKPGLDDEETTQQSEEGRS